MAKQPKPRPKPKPEQRTWDQLTDPETDVTGADEADELSIMEFGRRKKGPKRGKKPNT